MTQTELNTDKELIYKKIILNLMKNQTNAKEQTKTFKTNTEKEALIVSDVLNYFLGGSEITEQNKSFEVKSKGYYFYIGS